MSVSITHTLFLLLPKSEERMARNTVCFLRSTLIYPRNSTGRDVLCMSPLLCVSGSWTRVTVTQECYQSNRQLSVSLVVCLLVGPSAYLSGVNQEWFLSVCLRLPLSDCYNVHF